MEKQNKRQTYPPKGMEINAIEVHGPKSLKMESYGKYSEKDGGGDLREESVWLISPQRKIHLITPNINNGVNDQYQ